MSKRLAVIVICCSSPALASEAFEYLRKNSDPETTELILFDNGSQPPLPICGADKIIRSETNLGMGMPIFYSRDILSNELLAFFHVDLRVVEPSWDKRVIECFDNDPELALLGFVGSKKIDRLGGRGFITDTFLNFQGLEYATMQSSPAEAHGNRFSEYQRVLNLDGCSLILRNSVLQTLSTFESNGLPPSHYYDVFICCQILEKHLHVGLLGAAIDHAGGGIGTCKLGGAQPGLKIRDKTYTDWLIKNGYYPEEGKLDAQIYSIARNVFLTRWSSMLPMFLAE